MISSLFTNLTNLELIFMVIGFLGQGLFASRFIIQWIYSEKKGKSVIPIQFWYLSIFILILFAYLEDIFLIKLSFLLNLIPETNITLLSIL